MKIAKIFRTADVLSESRSRDLQNIKRIGKNVIVVIYRYCFYSSPPLVDILPRCFKVFTLRSYFGFMNYTWLKNLQESALWCGSGIGCQLIWRKRYFLTGGTAEEGSSGKIIRNRHWHCCCGVFFLSPYNEGCSLRGRVHFPSCFSAQVECSLFHIIAAFLTERPWPFFV